MTKVSTTPALTSGRWPRDPAVGALVDHEFPQNSEDGFEPDDSYFAATSSVDGYRRRFVLWAVLVNVTITMFAEVQRVVGTEVTLEYYCWREASVLLPSCQARLSEMHDEIFRWTESDGEMT